VSRVRREEVMMRQWFSVIVLIACGCQNRGVVPTPDASQLPMKYKDHNIIFVSFDALQASHVSSHGYPRNTTPTIDAIGNSGFQFKNTMSVASWTVPASMTWFTGVYPCEHRMTNKFVVYLPPVEKMSNLKELSPNMVTLAEILKENGYATGGFTGNAGVSGGFGYEQGFDIYYYDKWKFGSMDDSMPRALDWIEANRARKFFVFLHGYDIHGQRSPVEGYDYRFVDQNYDNRYTGSPQEHELLREEGLEKGELTLREADVNFWRAIYDEKIQRTDEKFKHFLEAFRKIGVSDKTLLILTSDHGTEFYEHRRFDHGFTLYNEQIHVPLILQLPGQSVGKSISDRVSSIDVMPTILDLLDVPITDNVKKQMRGTSLVPAMRGESVRRDVYSETEYRQYTYKRAIITPDDWKLIYTLETKQRELYNLRTDPHERTNLAESERELADGLERKLFMHYKSIGYDLTATRWEVGMNPVYPSQGKK